MEETQNDSTCGRKNQLKKTIVGLLILWLAVIIGISFISLHIYNSSNRYILKVLTTMAENASEHVSEVVENELRELELYARNLTDEQIANPQVSIDLFSTVREKNTYNNMSITSLDGTCYTKDGNQVNVAHREYFQKALAGKSNISYLLPSKNDGTHVNVYAVPIIRNDQVVAVLWASVKTENFFESLGLSGFEDYGRIFLINDEGTLISERNMTDDSYNFFEFISETGTPNEDSLNAMKQDFAAGTDGYQQFCYSNQKIYMYYTNMRVDDWWLLIRIPKATLWTFVAPQVNVVLAVSAVLAVIASIDLIMLYVHVKKVNNNIRKQAYVDNITEGKNDLYLKYNLASYLNGESQFALVSLEVVNLNGLVNVLGIQTVYQMICSLYKKLEEKMELGEVVVHSYFGEFKLLLKYTTVESLLKRIEQIDAVEAKMDFIMGVYPIESADVDYEDMCSYTNVAKGNLLPDCRYGIYTKELHKKEVEQVQLEESIKEGIAKQEFKAWFQPKYAMDGKNIIGAEALVRWYKEDKIIGPYVFIPLCEANGLIREIDCLVLEDVCRNLQQWLREGKNPVPISVNLSRNYLDEPDFIHRLENIIAVYQVPRHFIEFEVTESAMVGNEKKLKETIDALHNRGFKILLDDFGVGYSSIKTISDLHFDTVKIDKSFVDGIGQEQWDNIIQYTINLSKELNMKIVAEGVETKEQYEFLVKCGCDIFQGYYFDKPMDEPSFSALLCNVTTHV